MKLEYKTDNNGKGLFSTDGAHQVMMEWEKGYMEESINTMRPHGAVLEIGFGMGYSATKIQEFDISSHTIIECNPIVLEKLKKFQEDHPNVIVVPGRWQDVLQTLGKFDCIFFDDYLIEDTTIDRFSSFLHEILISHSIPGTKIGLYSNIDCLKYSNISCLNIDTSIFKVNIPSECNYTKGDKLYIPIITVLEGNYFNELLAFKQKIKDYSSTLNTIEKKEIVDNINVLIQAAITGQANGSYKLEEAHGIMTSVNVLRKKFS